MSEIENRKVVGILNPEGVPIPQVLVEGDGSIMLEIKPGRLPVRKSLKKSLDYQIPLPNMSEVLIPGGTEKRIEITTRQGPREFKFWEH